MKQINPQRQSAGHTARMVEQIIIAEFHLYNPHGYPRGLTFPPLSVWIAIFGRWQSAEIFLFSAMIGLSAMIGVSATIGVLPTISI